VKTIIMTEEKEQINNVEFKYADDVNPDKDREQYLRGQANMWFYPLIKEFNKENAKVNFLLMKGVENRVHFTGMSSDLEAKAYTRLKMFQNPSQGY
jgi:hypothetical protein